MYYARLDKLVTCGTFMKAKEEQNLRSLLGRYLKIIGHCQ